MTHKINLGIISVFALMLALPALVFAACPSNTTVTGTTVNFVGEVTDMGGDNSTNVWFQYGQSTSYGLQTNQQSVSQPGIYCTSVSNLSACTTYHYRAVAQNSAGVSYGLDKNFTTTCQSPFVNIQANGSDGPISVNSGSSVTLSWTSSNVSSCQASGDWSGSKAISGSETLSNITSSKNFTLTCSGNSGSSQDSVTVSVGNEVSSNFSVNKLVSNLSNGTNFANSIYAAPGDVVSYSIEVQSQSVVQNVILQDSLPQNIAIRQNSLKINGISAGGNIASGISLGNFSAGQEKTVTYTADIAGTSNFNFGQTVLTNTATVNFSGTSSQDTATVIVYKTAVEGAATGTPTAVSTGWTNNIWLNTIILPLLLAGALIVIFRTRIFKFEEWYDARRKGYRAYKSKKILDLKITKAKVKEILNKKSS